MTFLLLLVIVSYTRLERHINSTILHKEYSAYLVNGARERANCHQELIYDNQHAIGTPREQTGSQATRYFPLYQIVKDANAKEVFKRLLEELYLGHPFFDELKDKRPNFIEEITHDLASGLVKIIPLTRSQLSLIEMRDEELREAYTNMLRGNILKQKGYESLLHLISLQQARQKIQVSIAPEELLKALYGNEELVHTIMTRADDLISLKENKESSLRFEQEFKGSELPGVPETLLDYTISSTKRSKKRNYR